MASDTYVVHDPEGPDIEFEGEFLVERSAADIGRVKVYRTTSGRLVAEHQRNAFRGRQGIHRIGVFERSEELSAWLGHSAGAKAVLQAIGHSSRRRID